MSIDSAFQDFEDNHLDECLQQHFDELDQDHFNEVKLEAALRAPVPDHIKNSESAALWAWNYADEFVKLYQKRQQENV